MAQTPFFEKIDNTGQPSPWITMVHGASQHSGVFSAQTEAFRKDFRLLLIDLPGHGKSSLAGPFGPEEYADAVLAALDSAKIETTHFWGTHTGAGVALTLATQHLQRFDSLILEGAVIPGVELSSVTKNIGRAKTTAREKGLDAARKEWFERSEWFEVIRQHPEECRADQHWSMITEFSGAPWLHTATPRATRPVREMLSQISRPVLLVNGEHDLADFLHIAEELAAKLPHAERVLIPGAGGFPLWEYPSVVNPLVRHFLNKRA